MIRAVFDCNVVMAAIGWRNEPYLCFVHIARRRVRSFVTAFILEEYRRVAQRLEEEHVFRRSPWPTLDWFVSNSHQVVPSPLGKRRARDPNDDPYLACALAANAEVIVSRDPDLLQLRKPFGVEVLTPRALLSAVRQES